MLVLVMCGPADVINVSGHRIGSAEIESALVEHHDVAEAAVIGYPHDIKGQGICCYVILKAGIAESRDLEVALKNQVRKVIGPFATPDYVILSPVCAATCAACRCRSVVTACERLNVVTQLVLLMESFLL